MLRDPVAVVGGDEFGGARHSNGVEIGAASAAQGAGCAHMAGTGVAVLTSSDALAVEDSARLERFAAVIVLAADIHQAGCGEIAQELRL